jgi:hypothetical protein
VHAVFESLFDYDSFSVRVLQSHVDSLPSILKSIPADKVRRMQLRITHVWHRFAYRSGPALGAQLEATLADNARVVRQRNVSHPLLARPPPSLDDDALGTIMQWLYSRIPYTTPAQPGAGQ